MNGRKTTGNKIVGGGLLGLFRVLRIDEASSDDGLSPKRWLAGRKNGVLPGLRPWMAM